MLPQYTNTCFFNAAFALVRCIPGLSFRAPALQRLYAGETSEEVVRAAFAHLKIPYGREGDAEETLIMLIRDLESPSGIYVRTDEFSYLWQREPARNIPVMRDGRPAVRRTHSDGLYVKFRIHEDTSFPTMGGFWGRTDFEVNGVPIDFRNPECFSMEKDYVFDGGKPLPLRDLVEKYGFSVEGDKEGLHLMGAIASRQTPLGDHFIVNVDSSDYATGGKFSLHIDELFAPLTFGCKTYVPTVVIMHVGTVQTGHYYVIKRDDDQFRVCDGDRVYTVPPEGATLPGTPTSFLYSS